MFRRRRSIRCAPDVLKKSPKAREWVEYEGSVADNEFAGAEMAFGQPLYAHASYDKAKVVLALDQLIF